MRLTVNVEGSRLAVCPEGQPSEVQFYIVPAIEGSALAQEMVEATNLCRSRGEHGDLDRRAAAGMRTEELISSRRWLS